MTRKEYMEQLKKYLKRLPKEDYDNAIEYFSEYFLSLIHIYERYGNLWITGNLRIQIPMILML